jgi:putative ABC transport system permease protein
MFAGELLRSFVDDLRHQRLRTLLTILGITWGTVSVAVLLAFGAGLKNQMTINAHGIGDGLVIAWGGKTTKPWEGFPEGRSTHLRDTYVDIISREVPGVVAISPEYSNWSPPTHRGTASSNAAIGGVLASFAAIRNIFADSGGRFLDQRDVDEKRRVAFLGDDLKKLLFGDGEAVGRQVFIGKVPFTVVGVMRHKVQNSSYMARDKDRVFIPATTFKALYGARYLNNIVFKVGDPTRSADIVRQVRAVVARHERFDPTDEDANPMWDTNDMMKMFAAIFLGFNLFLGILGFFTLLVGGIGVANIMFVVVRERTPEIGLKRSVGARRRDILLQFFTESLFIVSIGATVGMLITLGIVTVGRFMPASAIEAVGVPVLSPGVLGATMALLAGVAFLAAYFPAQRAASLDPVECMR